MERWHVFYADKSPWRVERGQEVINQNGVRMPCAGE